MSYCSLPTGQRNPVAGISRNLSIALSVVAMVMPAVVMPVVVMPVNAAADPTPPKIEIAAPLFDFGVVPEGTRVKHDFEIANTGEVELVIQGVVPGCGCTAAVAQDPKVAPGAKGVVHTEFDTTGFSGEKAKQIRINSNDPVTPSTFVTLKGTIDTEVVFEPERVQLGEFVVAVEDGMPERDVRIRSTGSTQIVGVTAGSPAIAVETVKSSPTEWDIRVKPAANASPGDIRNRVVVTLSRSGETRETNIPVIGKGIGPVVVKPGSVAMGILEGNAPIERRVQVESRRQKVFTIASIDSDNAAVSVTKKDIEPGRAVVLLVRVDPKVVKEDLRSTVTLTFDDPELAPIQFSVYGVRPPTLE